MRRRLFSRLAMGLVIGLAAVPALLCAPRAHGVVFNGFNGTGFDSAWDGFVQTSSPTSVRLTDPQDGWGGATTTFGTPMDMSALLNQYLQVDYTVEPGHGSGRFAFEFYDTSNRSVKLSVPAPVSAIGQPRTFTVTNAFGQPADGFGDFENFDFSQVQTFGVLGHWESPQPFDVSIDEVRFTPDAPPAYVGRAPDAAWRAQADARIDQNRKADLQINLHRPNGSPIANANVRVIQKKHAFKFGSAVTAGRITGASPTDAAYRTKVLELFNTVTLENDLKWEALEGDWGANFSRAQTFAALDWLDQQSLNVRGHTLVWPSWDNLPQRILALQNDPPALRQAVLDHIADIGAATQGKVVDWDVLNEPRVNHDLMDVFGEAVMDEWFAAADAVNDARLLVNEYNIITGNETFGPERAAYLQTLEGLLTRGAPLDAVAMQGHFNAGTLTDIENLWAILDEFSNGTGLPIAITEFDLSTPDQQLRADYLRDFMTAVFAHDAVDEFSLWGFWEGQQFAPDAALFNSDWSATPAGQAYLDLVHDQWWTDEALATDAQGAAQLRAFQGDYRIEVQVAGEVETYDVTVGPDGLTLSKVIAAALAGDYNGNGQVEQGDLDLVLQNWGQDFTAGGLSASWIHDLPIGQVDQSELDKVLQNWGDVNLPAFGSEGALVPEPVAGASLLLLGAGARRIGRHAVR